MQYAVADLGGGVLGSANAATNQIRIDDDAAMLGWSVIGDRWSMERGQWSDESQGTTDNGQLTTDN